MNALADAFCEKRGMTATSSISDGQQIWFAANIRMINRIIDVVADPDLYESREEPKPSPVAIIAAANVLRNLATQDLENVEIEPYSGELSLVWKAGQSSNGRRVKAMFGGRDNSYSVYYEQMANRRVVDRHLEPNADSAYLRGRLAWLHA